MAAHLELNGRGWPIIVVQQRAYRLLAPLDLLDLCINDYDDETGVMALITVPCSAIGTYSIDVWRRGGGFFNRLLVLLFWPALLFDIAVSVVLFYYLYNEMIVFFLRYFLVPVMFVFMVVLAYGPYMFFIGLLWASIPPYWPEVFVHFIIWECRQLAHDIFASAEQVVIAYWRIIQLPFYLAFDLLNCICCGCSRSRAIGGEQDIEMHPSGGKVQWHAQRQGQEPWNTQQQRMEHIQKRSEDHQQHPEGQQQDPEGLQEHFEDQQWPVRPKPRRASLEGIGPWLESLGVAAPSGKHRLD